MSSHQTNAWWTICTHTGLGPLIKNGVLGLSESAWNRLSNVDMKEKATEKNIAPKVFLIVTGKTPC